MLLPLSPSLQRARAGKNEGGTEGLPARTRWWQGGDGSGGDGRSGSVSSSGLKGLLPTMPRVRALSLASPATAASRQLVTQQNTHPPAPQPPSLSVMLKYACAPLATTLPLRRPQRRAYQKPPDVFFRACTFSPHHHIHTFPVRMRNSVFRAHSLARPAVTIQMMTHARF